MTTTPSAWDLTPQHQQTEKSRAAGVLGTLGVACTTGHLELYFPQEKSWLLRHCEAPLRGLTRHVIFQLQGGPGMLAGVGWIVLILTSSASAFR